MSVYLYIAGNRNGRGHIYTLERNEYGQYLHLLEREIIVFDNTRDIDSDGNTLCVTFENDTNILTISLADGIPDSKTMSTNEIDVKNSDPLSGNIHIAKDTMGILISDFHNQRILHLSDTFNVLDYFGSYGNGEKEFLMPSIIETFENRIFIYDEGRDG